MRTNHTAFSADTRYVSSNTARTPESAREALRIYFNILLGVAVMYIVFYYLVPLM